MLTFNPQVAATADQVNSAIRESGKYIGTITRAEKLLSSANSKGLGLSFKADDGSTADYLDLYTTNANGDVLPSAKTVQAILGCLKLREAKDGKIECEKYDKDTKSRKKMVLDGYPDLMGKRIGFLLQKELSTNTKNGEDTDRVIVFGVFQADTELTVSEIVARKTTPETLPKMLEALMARPVRDSRKKRANAAQHGMPDQQYHEGTPATMDDFDIPF
jgi:hypothetical protein